MAEEKADYVLLLGHWNGPGDGCAVDMTVPAVYKEISALPGCDKLGDRLKAFDGHTHCNHVQASGHAEEVIFMIGGHGMLGCSQYGFAYLESEKVCAWDSARQASLQGTRNLQVVIVLERPSRLLLRGAHLRGGQLRKDPILHPGERSCPVHPPRYAVG